MQAEGELGVLQREERHGRRIVHPAGKSGSAGRGANAAFGEPAVVNCVLFAGGLAKLAAFPQSRRRLPGIREAKK